MGHSHRVKEKLLRIVMLQRQVLKKMLEFKLPVEKVVYDCGTEDCHRANKGSVIIPCKAIGQAT